MNYKIIYLFIIIFFKIIILFLKVCCFLIKIIEFNYSLKLNLKRNTVLNYDKIIK